MEKELLAPNGKPSNLTPEQYKLVRTAAFKNWFGNWESDPENSSKFVDKNGEPLVVYHGTGEEFNVFEKTRFGKLGQAMYFTPYLADAEKYAKKTDSERVIKAFLNSRKLAVISNPYAKKELPNEYDAIWAYKGGGEGEEIAVFEPNQIKLADGNNTTFDSSNDDIRFEQGGETKYTTPDYLVMFLGK